jgi:hypothetical protein
VKTLALAVLLVAVACSAANASAAIIVTQPPATLCLASTARFDLEMFLNEMWRNSAAVKGRIEIVSSDGRRLATRLGTFATGLFRLAYTPRSAGRYRIVYSWFIPRAYLARQPLRTGSRAFYRVDRWQTAATWVTLVKSCH